MAYRRTRRPSILRQYHTAYRHTHRIGTARQYGTASGSVSGVVPGAGTTRSEPRTALHYQNSAPRIKCITLPPQHESQLRETANWGRGGQGQGGTPVHALYQYQHAPSQYQHTLPQYQQTLSQYQHALSQYGGAGYPHTLSQYGRLPAYAAGVPAYAIGVREATSRKAWRAARERRLSSLLLPPSCSSLSPLPPTALLAHSSHAPLPLSSALLPVSCSVRDSRNHCEAHIHTRKLGAGVRRVERIRVRALLGPRRVEDGGLGV
eukprot:2570965-Rhodomonas_salina.2